MFFVFLLKYDEPHRMGNVLLKHQIGALTKAIGIALLPPSNPTTHILIQATQAIALSSCLNSPTWIGQGPGCAPALHVCDALLEALVIKRLLYDLLVLLISS
jgi:hypothetical protein